MSLNDVRFGQLPRQHSPAPTSHASALLAPLFGGTVEQSSRVRRTATIASNLLNRPSEGAGTRLSIKA